MKVETLVKQKDFESAFRLYMKEEEPESLHVLYICRSWWAEETERIVQKLLFVKIVGKEKFIISTSDQFRIMGAVMTT